MRRIAQELPSARVRHHFPQARPAYRMETAIGIMREKSPREGRRMHIARDVARTEKDRMWRI